MPGWLEALLVVVAVALVGGHRGPAPPPPASRSRRHQVKEAWDNIRGVLSTPRKALELFGGNLVSQLLFAMVLGAALHAYGESLPLLQLVVINSFASFIGGVAPVPGAWASSRRG